MVPERASVALLGEFPANASEPFLERHLDVLRVQDAAECLSRLNALTAVAIQFPFDPSDDERRKATKLISGVMPVCMNAGIRVGIILALPPKGIDSEHIGAATARTRAFVSGIVSSLLRDEIDDRIRTFDASDLMSFAELAARHDPGPPINSLLTIVCPPDYSVSEDAEVSLKRAFHDFQRIEIHELTGGLSDADAVWRIHAFNAVGLRTEPFAVKLGPRRLITTEIEETQRISEFYVSFPHRPPLLLSRCVQGFTKRLMVSMFVDRAVRMDRYIATVSPRLAIASIFDGPLRTLRSRKFHREMHLPTAYAEYGIFKKLDSHELHAAYDHAARISSTVEEPSVLRDLAFSSLPRIVDVCAAHGDLHMKNLWVRDNNVDVVLIDLEKATFESPVSRDPAVLDVSLAYDAEKLPFLSDEILARLYAPKVLHGDIADITDNRAQAIQQLRLQALATCQDVDEYDLTIAFLLLRMSRKLIERGKVHEAGMAYALASELLVEAIARAEEAQ